MRAINLRPTRRALQVAALWVVASVALAFLAPWFALSFEVWLALSAAVAILLLADFLLLAAQRGDHAALHVQRQLPAAFALDVEKHVTLAIENRGDRSVRGTLFDHYPVEIHALGLPADVTVPPASKAEVPYRLLPIQRGLVTFGKVEWWQQSPVGLWEWRHELGHAQSIRVYPNFAAVAKYAMLAHDRQLASAGLRQRRRRGEGLDFRELREYREGDSLRQIDWKAVTRRQKLISREYQDERDQRVMFLLDCGRRMRAQDADITHFDQAMNALMLLAHVALKQGDAVGAMTFGGEERFIEPRKGNHALSGLMSHLYDLQPQARTADYLQAAQQLMRRFTKRALVVVLTNLRDEDASELNSALHLLRSRHLVLLASLREAPLAELTTQTITNLDDAITVASAHHYLKSRADTFTRLLGKETLAFDVEPAQLPMALVNRYMDVKRSGRL